MHAAQHTATHVIDTY